MPAFGRTNDQKKQHKERSQPFNRQRYGLLEKKKDYVLRANDYKQKQQRLKALQNKVNQKNEDEFYFGMVKQKTKRGLATKSRGNESLGQDVTKLLKTQDSAYIKTILAIERKKIEALHNQRHMLGMRTSEDESTRDNHIAFVESEAQMLAFEPANGVAESFAKPSVDVARTRKQNKTAQRMSERELEARQDRVNKLRVLEKEVNLHRNLQTKGSRKLIGKDKDGTAKYKWKQERKR